MRIREAADRLAAGLAKIVRALRIPFRELDRQGSTRLREVHAEVHRMGFYPTTSSFPLQSRAEHSNKVETCTRQLRKPHAQ
jgi:hypothetical protein